MGKLRVKILACRDLKSSDFFGGESDPYVKIAVGKKSFRTSTVDNNNNPTFNEDFTFFIADPHRDVMVFTVMDGDLVKDDVLAVASFALGQLRHSVETEMWFKLANPEGGAEPSGEIGVVFTAEDFGCDVVLPPSVPAPALAASPPVSVPPPALVSGESTAASEAV